MPYYLHKNEQQTGPFSKREIFDKILSGKISEEDYCWSEGMENWAPIKTLQLTNPSSWSDEEARNVPDHVSQRMRSAFDQKDEKQKVTYSLPVRIVSTCMGLLVLSAMAFAFYLKWERRAERVQHLFQTKNQTSGLEK